MLSVSLVCIVLVAEALGAPIVRKNAPLFSVDYSNYKEGDKPDIYKDYYAPTDGCFGVYRKGGNCASSKPNTCFIRKDPSNSDGKVMEVTVKGHTYGTSKSYSGSQFYTHHLREISVLLEATLEYEVYFPEDFEWTLGGKLPGMYGGDKECSGERPSDGTNCFSTRLMWREDGEGEAYMYIPVEEQQFDVQDKCHMGDDPTHCSLNRGVLNFQAGSWNKLKQIITLNTVGDNDGWFELYHNNKLVMKERIVYRTTEKLRLSGMFFSTFFGGDSEEYAPERDQYLSFKNIVLSPGRA
ncbi:hypothetical protein SARC_06050 [Sphaeroforma arctica JP610]|uniref:Polysaccharide lyase 14 domain-containing protein n=1 Tax=Sphaeroforma arctica JP610 TaxID=667725 RepID=A0A0L0FXU0_9EUKA|nr:hypothetical protein SARC_06050 [Sphaeroforma arctica JP610]KNC81645.1 hypothetical protein SARC_06050 [Sphaeroforma arctica JP610]|eukprot:XP_014155547.1 hypothetical protein SARC_06050 [Sphaeroforma arctica JP610]